MRDARRFLLPLTVIAAVILVYLILPWGEEFGGIPLPDIPAKGSQLNSIATIAFWLIAIAIVVLMIADSRDPQTPQVEVRSPRFASYLFGNTRAGLFWLPIRIFLGIEWLEAGLHKLTGTGWVDGGSSLLGFWQNAVAIPEEGRPPISYDWYRTFIQWLIDNNAQGWFAWLITIGEIAVGLGLLFGALTGFAAFFGALMNMSFLLAGSASSNPIMFTLAVGLMLAWKVAGYYGVDRWLLPMLGVPWHAKLDVSQPTPRTPQEAPTN